MTDREQELADLIIEALYQRTARLHSTLYKYAWKKRATPLGNEVDALRATAARGEKAAPWATSAVHDTHGMDVKRYDESGKVEGRSGALQDQVQLTDWLTPRSSENVQTNLDEIAAKGSSWLGQGRGATVATMAQLSDWPTPNAMAGGQTSRGGERKGELLIGGLAQLAPWPTATKEDARSSRRHGYMITGQQGTPLTDAANLSGAPWPTPRAEDAECTGAHRGVPDTLTSASELTSWGTPTAQDAKHGCLSPSEMLCDPNVLRNQAHLASWPTPNALDTMDRETMRPSRAATGRKVGYLTEAVATYAKPEGEPTCEEDPQAAPWATPASRDWRDGRASEETMEKNARPLNEQAVSLAPWPTPMSVPDSEASHNQMSGQYRRQMAKCSPWPTPVAQPANGTPEAFLERKRKAVANGSTMGICISDIAMAADLTAPEAAWPTPRGQDSYERRNWKTMTKIAEEGGDMTLVTAVKTRLQAPPEASGETASGSPAATEKRGQLNPSLPRWLMSIPEAWDLCIPPKRIPQRTSRRSSSARKPASED